MRHTAHGPAEVVVFLGPTLSHEEAGRILPAAYRPPLERGDMDALGHGTVAAIIDGQLGPAAVAPEAEIRRALDRGIRVYGAGSTGALRAAGLGDAGMIGIGWVYEAYRTGRIASVDDIAVLYDPGRLRPLTIPVVSILHLAETLEAAGEIDAVTASRAVQAVRQLDLHDRDRKTVRARLAPILGDDRLERCLCDHAGSFPNPKADDARRLLRLLSHRHGDAGGGTSSRTAP